MKLSDNASTCVVHFKSAHSTFALPNTTQSGSEAEIIIGHSQWTIVHWVDISASFILNRLEMLRYAPVTPKPLKGKVVENAWTNNGQYHI